MHRIEFELKWLYVIAHVTATRRKTGFREENPADEYRYEWELDDIEIHCDGETILELIGDLKNYPNIKARINAYIESKIWDLEEFL